jgi:hypothetical protein
MERARIYGFSVNFLSILAFSRRGQVEDVRLSRASLRAPLSSEKGMARAIR